MSRSWCQPCVFSCVQALGAISRYSSLFDFGQNPKAIPANEYVINTEIFLCAWQPLYNYLTLTAVSDLQSVVCFLQAWH